MSVNPHAGARLANKITDINLVALDKTLKACSLADGYKKALDHMVRIRDRMEAAAVEVAKCL